MKIRTKLYFSAIVSIGLLITLSLSLFAFFIKVNEEIKRETLADEFTRSITDVLILAHEYATFQAPRIEHLLGSKIERIDEIINKSEGILPLEIIRNAVRSLGNAFSKLKEIYKERKQLLKQDASQEELDRTAYIEDALATIIYTESLKILAVASRISSEARENTAALQERGHLLVSIFALVLVVIIGISALWIARSITRPLMALEKSADTIGAGNLEKAVPILGRDELGSLAKTIEDMRLKRKRSEEELRKYRHQLEKLVEVRTSKLQAANKELEDFAYSVSHDLKAPLRAIIGFSEIISRRHRESLNEESRRYFDHILTAGNTMNRLIEDLLRYSRLGRRALKVRPVPLADVFSELYNLFQDRVKEAGGSLDIPDDPPTVRGDETLLSQIFTNLVDNGLAYGRPDVPPRVEINWHTEGDRVIVSVKDNGIGIPAEFQEKVFNIFQRLHSEAEKPGTGIGLALVRKAAAMLEGRVRLESAVGEGSTFYVDLPFSKEERNDDQASPYPLG